MKIINLIEEINKALPQLKDINGNTKTISIQNWNNRIKTIQTKIKNKYKRYSGFPTYSTYLHPCIVEHRENDLILIDEERYKLIRSYLLSDEFNLKEEL